MVLITQPQQKILNTPILITYEVCQPNITIHTPTSTTPILCIPELLNINVTTHTVVCMHNTSNVPAYFLWGNPVGKQKHCINLSFSPKAGMIEPRNTFRATVTLKPQQTGILEHIYVPCFIGRVAEPVILTVMCAVDGIHVCFSLPEDKKIYWPPKIIDEHDISSAFHLPSYLYEEENGESFHMDIVNTDTKFCFQELLQGKSYIDVNPQQQTNLHAVMQPAELLCLEYHEQTPEMLSEEFVSIEKQRLIEAFDSSLILEDYFVEVRDVPLKTRN